MYFHMYSTSFLGRKLEIPITTDTAILKNYYRTVINKYAWATRLEAERKRDITAVVMCVIFCSNDMQKISGNRAVFIKARNSQNANVYTTNVESLCVQGQMTLCLLCCVPNTTVLRDALLLCDTRPMMRDTMKRKPVSL
jgi:hypothetical protein